MLKVSQKKQYSFIMLFIFKKRIKPFFTIRLCLILMYNQNFSAGTGIGTLQRCALGAQYPLPLFSILFSNSSSCGGF